MEPHAQALVKTRIDLLLVSRGLAHSRERARALLLSGDVSVGGAVVTKAGTLVDAEAAVVLKQPDHPWASRGGLKLAHALEVFGLDVRGKTAIDIGASTGGFTDVLLQAGATRVVAIDVGRGQLDWRLRTDSRVVVLDGVNARHLVPADLPADLGRVALVTIDVSFISLRHILPVAAQSVAADGHVVALVKPQFEAGRDAVGKGGIVRDPAVHDKVLAAVGGHAVQVGLDPVRVVPSPITGATGNVEFLMWLRPMRAAAKEDAGRTAPT
jgi:23S rRNA (cytidine1920-2'-O)/16S rRNA (cytidine1409-2'-O)-methyltransferase